MRPDRTKRHTARGIVVHNGRVLLMERWRTDDDGHELHYFSVPGGGIRPGEMPEATVVREFYEEMMVVVRPRQKVLELRDHNGGTHIYYQCDYLSGDAQLNPDSPEATEFTSERNKFKPCWLSASAFAKATLNEIYEPSRVIIEKLLEK